MKKKQSTPSIIELRCFRLPTQDNWYPNFERNTVLVRVSEWINASKDSKYMFRVSVWGADDDGMERDTFVSKKERVEFREALLKEVDNFPNPLNKDWLKSKGFVRA